MDIRYSANQKDFKRYTTEETRNASGTGTPMTIVIPM